MSDIQEQIKLAHKKAEENDIKLLQEENNNLKKIKERYQLEKEIYKSRNEKAIEYINKYKNQNWYRESRFTEELLDILQGVDKE